GESEHRRVKRYYARTNKVNHTAQIARQERRNARLRRMKQKEAMQASTARTSLTIRGDAPEKLPKTEPQMTTHISLSRRYPENATSFLARHEDDPALKPFYRKLKEHLLPRIRGTPDSGRAYTAEERNSIIFLGNRIYKHKILRLNYTSYDVRRKQDFLNPSKNANIMVLSGEGDHPYWYGRIIGIFHADVADLYSAAPSEGRAVHFAYVRWYTLDPTFRHGIAAKRFPRLHFFPADHPDAFGFIDPSSILRAAHIIPAFAYGRTNQYLAGVTVARPLTELDDYRFYYAAM
ncbi:hypothetical protein EV121DRAFT_206777, partial [Schizophyllum commune]